MTNNDIFKKLRVALQLRDDQITEILELVDFRISKGEVGNFFRNEEHPKYVECGDQILRNFLNGLVIYLRGTKENPKNPLAVIKSHTENKIQFKKEVATPSTPERKIVSSQKNTKPKFSKPKNTKTNPVEKFTFKPGKTKK